MVASYYTQLGSSEFGLDPVTIERDGHVVDQHKYCNSPP